MGAFLVHPEESDLLSSCPCCAGPQDLRGFVYESGEPRAFYFVQPLGTLSFPMAKIGLVYGPWSETTDASGRFAVAFICRPGPQGPILQPVDAVFDQFPEFDRLGKKLAPDELGSTGQAERFLVLTRAIIDQDWRLAPLGRNESTLAVKGRFAAPAD